MTDPRSPGRALQATPALPLPAPDEPRIFSRWSEVFHEGCVAPFRAPGGGSAYTHGWKWAMMSWPLRGVAPHHSAGRISSVRAAASGETRATKLVKIVLVGRMATAAEKLLRAAVGADHEVLAMPDASAAQENPRSFDGAHVIVGGPVTQQMAERARDLKLFHVFRGGTGGLGVEHLPPSVTIANTYHHEKSIADFVLLAMLVLARKGCERDRQLRKGNWSGSAWWSAPPEVDALDGKTVLILGLGHIGSEVARRVGLRDESPRLVSDS